MARYRPKHRQPSPLVTVWQWHASLLVAASTFLMLPGWIDNIINLGRRGINDVVDALRSAVTYLEQWAQGEFDWTIGRIIETVNWITNFGWDAWNGVQWIYGALTRQWDSIWAGIVSWSNAAENAAIGWARDSVGQVWDWLDSLQRSINGAFDSVYKWIADNIWTPIQNRIEDLQSYALGGFDNVWKRIADVEQSIAEKVVTIVNALYSPVIRPLTDAIGALSSYIDKARNVLDFFINHPTDWFWVLLRGFLDRLQRDIIAGILSAVEANGEMVESWFEKWLKS